MDRVIWIGLSGGNIGATRYHLDRYCRAHSKTAKRIPTFESYAIAVGLKLCTNCKKREN